MTSSLLAQAGLNLAQLKAGFSARLLWKSQEIVEGSSDPANLFFVILCDHLYKKLYINSIFEAVCENNFLRTKTCWGCTMGSETGRDK